MADPAQTGIFPGIDREISWNTGTIQISRRVVTRLCSLGIFHTWGGGGWISVITEFQARYISKQHRTVPFINIMQQKFH